MLKHACRAHTWCRHTAVVPLGRKINCVLSKYWSGGESCQRGGSRENMLRSLTHADASRPGPCRVPAASLSKSPSLTTPRQRFRVSSRRPTGINPSCSGSSRADRCCRLSVVSGGSGVFKINLSCLLFSLPGRLCNQEQWNHYSSWWNDSSLKFYGGSRCSFVSIFCSSTLSFKVLEELLQAYGGHEDQIMQRQLNKARQHLSELNNNFYLFRKQIQRKNPVNLYCMTFRAIPEFAH